MERSSGGIPDEGGGCETGLITLRCEDCSSVVLTRCIWPKTKETLGLL